MQKCTSFFMIKPSPLKIVGTSQEQDLFSDCNGHTKIAKEDLDQRIYRKNGFDDADKMFASYIDESSWPYRSLMFDPVPYTTILEKSARLVGSKPKGRLVPREGGDELGAFINNELLSFQWDDNTRLGESMVAKWIMMDQNARKYGSSFGLVKWHTEKRVTIDDSGKKKKVKFYDGPDFTVCNSRDVLANPSYSFINKWFQYREYTTMDELEAVNDSAIGDPIYKNLDLLKEALRDDIKVKGDNRSSTTQIKNKSIRGLTDYLGRDEVFPVIELITEYRPDRWITFAPKHGVIVRDIPNPYKHGEMPVIHLKYYPLQDDLYGVGELEPVAKEIKAINAHLSAYSDTIALALRPPIHVNPINVRMHTIEWNPEAKWLMNTPNVDVQQMRIDTSMTTNFQSIYYVLKGSLMTALGEQSQGISNVNPTQDKGRVTATEIQSGAQTRNVRDNMNQIFLAEALKKQIMYWHSMNQQFMFKGQVEKQRIVRIVGRDANEYFMQQGLADVRPTHQDALDIASGKIAPNSYVPGPRFAIGGGTNADGTPAELPKYMPDENGTGGNLIVEPGDLLGDYDYIPDIESMGAPSDIEVQQKLMAILGTLSNPVIMQMLAQEGKKPKVSELLVKMFESTKVIHDASNYFEDAAPPQSVVQGGGVNVQNQVNGAGTPGPAGGVPTQGAVPAGGVGGSPPAIPGSASQVVPSGPPQV